MTNAAAIEVGARSTRKGAKLHVAAGCGWATSTPLVGKLVELTERNAQRVCRNCAKAVRLAIDAARAANTDRTASSHRIVMDKIVVESRLIVLADLFLSRAEIERRTELLSRPRTALVEQEVTAAVTEIDDDLISLIPDAKPLSPWGALRANNLRTLPQPTGHVPAVKLAA